MPNRNVEGNYRYGYQGEFAEKEPELGNGQNSFELRQWDSRIGRWLNPDPGKEFNSPYLGMGNNPIKYLDRKGDSVWVYTERIKGLGGHLFLRVKTTNIDVTIELAGPKLLHDWNQDGEDEKFNGRTGIPTMKEFDPKWFKNGRGYVHGPYFVGHSEDNSLELGIIKDFFKFTYRRKDENDVYDFPDLPDYHYWNLNSNGFIQALLNNNGYGVKQESFFPIRPHHPGINDTGPYMDILDPDHHKIENNN